MEIGKSIDAIGEALSDLWEVVARENDGGAPLEAVERYLWRAIEDAARAARIFEEVRV